MTQLAKYVLMPTPGVIIFGAGDTATVQNARYSTSLILF